MIRRSRRHCFFLVLLLLWQQSDAAAKCERLKTKHPVTYTQDEAPRDLSGVLPAVIEKVNSLLEGVVDVEVEWTGLDLQGGVGEHLIVARVTRLATPSMGATVDEIIVDDHGRELFTKCYQVPFDITDVDECRLPDRHPMRHQCHSSAVCVNTIGAYECVCPRIITADDIDRKALLVDNTATETFWRGLAAQERGPWELSLATSYFCPNQASTHGCCPSLMTKGDSAQCRKGFYCPVDPCKNHDCGDTATCIRADTPMERPNHVCQCPDGLMGNGRRCLPSDPRPEPKVKYDGKTPTELTVKNNFYCGCTKPVVDPCDGFPPCKEKHQVCTVLADKRPVCACKKGYVPHETYGCVDESPPTLVLKHDPNRDQTLRLRQGDFYKEYAVEIKDENAEEYLRSLKIAYSAPIPNGCLTKIGDFTVTYSIDTPWTVPPVQKIIRKVITDDIDECSLDVEKYQRICPPLIPHCDTDAGAKCVNTIGSYTCKCPVHTTGDGFQKGVSFDQLNAPEGFRGGQSCHDTGKPVIQLQGPNPKIFRVCGCGGITGIMNQKLEQDIGLKTSQQSHYESDILSLVQMTEGAELCATHTNSSPKASDCVIAFDETYKGRVDLSKKVVVGKPVRKSPTRWSVPYDVKDAAGNEAVTVWRDIVVEEVDLADVEARIRREVLHDKQREIDAAVSRALAKTNGGRRSVAQGKTCPACPPCDCSGNGAPIGAASQSSCDQVCPSPASNPKTSPPPGPIFSPFVEMTGSYAFENAASLGLGAIVALVSVVGCLLLFACCCYRPSPTYEDLRYGPVVIDPNNAYPRDRFDPTTPRTPARYADPQSQQPHFNIFNSGGTLGGERSHATMNGYGGTPTSAHRREQQDQQQQPLQEMTADSVFLRSPRRSIINPSPTGDGVNRTPR